MEILKSLRRLLSRDDEDGDDEHERERELHDADDEDSDRDHDDNDRRDDDRQQHGSGHDHDDKNDEDEDDSDRDKSSPSASRSASDTKTAMAPQEAESDDDDLVGLESIEENEVDLYDITKNLRSIRADLLPTDMLSTRSARGPSPTPSKEDLRKKKGKKDKGGDRDTETARTSSMTKTTDSRRCPKSDVPPPDIFTAKTPSITNMAASKNVKVAQHTDVEDISTARTVPSEVNLAIIGEKKKTKKREQPEADILTAKAPEPACRTPSFDSDDWAGKPHASRGPHCDCATRGRATCTCSFLLTTNHQNQHTNHV